MYDCKSNQPLQPNVTPSPEPYDVSSQNPREPQMTTAEFENESLLQFFFSPEGVTTSAVIRGWGDNADHKEPDMNTSVQLNQGSKWLEQRTSHSMGSRKITEVLQ
jgi:hypothetical protein